MSNKWGSKWIRPAKRLALYARDEWTCVYCEVMGGEFGAGLVLDHVLARDLGGGNEATNLVTACRSCNQLKRDLPVRAFLALLRLRKRDVEGLADRVRNAKRRRYSIAVGRELFARKRAWLDVYAPEPFEPTSVPF